jgi:hypothetical protein
VVLPRKKALDLSLLDEGQSFFDVLVLLHGTSSHFADLVRYGVPLQSCRLFGQILV